MKKKKNKSVLRAYVHESLLNEKEQKKIKFLNAYAEKPNKHYKEVIIIEV